MQAPAPWDRGFPAFEAIPLRAARAGLGGSARAAMSPSLPLAVSCRRRAEYDSSCGLLDGMSTSPGGSRFVLPARPRASASLAGDKLPQPAAEGAVRPPAGTCGPKGASPLPFEAAPTSASASKHCGAGPAMDGAPKGCLGGWGAAVASKQSRSDSDSVRAGASPSEPVHPTRPASETSPGSQAVSPPLSPAESTGDARSKGKARVLCADCGRSFGRQADLNRHVRHVHQRRRNFRCPFCSHEFAERGHFTSHVAAVHRRQHAADSSAASKQALSRLAEACRIAGNGDWASSVDSVARSLAPICRSGSTQSLVDMLVRTSRHSFAGSPSSRSAGARDDVGKLETASGCAQWPATPSAGGRPRGGSSGGDTATISPPGAAQVFSQAYQHDQLADRQELPSAMHNVRPSSSVHHLRASVSQAAGIDSRYDSTRQPSHPAHPQWHPVGYGGPDAAVFHHAAQWHPAMGASPYHHMLPFPGQASVVVMTPSGPMLMPRSVFEQTGAPHVRDPAYGHPPLGAGAGAPSVVAPMALSQAQHQDFLAHQTAQQMLARGPSTPGTLPRPDGHWGAQAFPLCAPVSSGTCPTSAPCAAPLPSRQEPPRQAHRGVMDTSMGALAAVATSEHLTSSTPPVPLSAGAGAMPAAATGFIGHVVVPRIR